MSKFTDELSGFLALFNPWAGLFVQAVTMVESMSAAAATPPTGPQKKSAAVDAVTAAINAAPAVTADVTAIQTAIKTNDPATVAAGIGHGIELALSIAKSFGLFPKAAIVQNAVPLVAGAADANAPGG